ncbi:hypothetical protein GCM10022384_48630 [Streptomyces marokkonensis]|uniref:Uncharacterized protein n=1 Tax=Streptomyces marokkonensis TaxID=324855 RepID=A0ABP7RC37_9ACTN
MRPSRAWSPEAELERPTRVSLTDTERKKPRLVDLGTSYSFRSLARGPQGQALGLGTDGAIHVIDQNTGRSRRRSPAAGEWQQARPTLFVRGHVAYVSEPGKKALHAIAVETGEKITSFTLPKSTSELSGVVAGHRLRNVPSPHRP